MPGLTTDDELAIRNLVARYADAVCRRDATSWTATWAPDSTWEVGSVTTHGPAEARAFWQSALAKYPWLVQVVASGEVFEGETGPRGVWYVVELQQVEDGNVRMVVGRYEDRYVNHAGRWAFASRRFQMTYRGERGPAEVTPLAAALAAPS